ncbi:LacI family DNA-binding transcriptional regulator [Evansella tamaricis]|uniref:LacI family transcriptional regulator n=1 Tax=Evansella tamaricis TaxID=2069301 RepID=A0ABS6JB02_9BACI|nr:LacI family DNA-binding transcriptional regulator [Evansella tamaricis]MBU9710856.1 LacI family transcriptional regulator [Evansella tamaricis]
MKQRPNIHDVADRAGVSIATVSNVINEKGRVSEKTVSKVKMIIEEMGFTPNLSARSLKQMKSSLIGLIVPFQQDDGNLQDNPFYWNLVSGIEAGTRDQKFHVIISGVNENKGEVLDFVKERNIDGLVVVGTYQGSPIMERIKEMQVPCVFIDSYLMEPDLYQVYLDDEQGGYTGTKYLLDKGHTKIAVVGGEAKEDGVTKGRLQGHRIALESRGLTYDERYRIETPGSMEGGYLAAEEIRKLSDVTAVFCFSDVVAFGLMKGLHDLDYKIPEDISIIGFDDLYFSKYVSPPLTTISQDVSMKGRMATQLLIKQIEKMEVVNKKIVLPIDLRERESVIELPSVKLNN